MTALMRRCVVPGRAYCVQTLTGPQRRTVAVALRGLDGWKVADRAGVIAVRLDQPAAVALMLRTALAATAAL